MGAVNTVSNLNGLFKEVYGDSIDNLLPDFSIISKKVEFKQSEKIGEQFVLPVKLQFEHGFTYGASGDGAFALNASVAGVIGRAQVNSAQIVLRSQMDYESAFKAVAGGKQAFADASQAMVENMTESFAKRQELAFLYGASSTGLGAISVSSVSGNATVTISDATWAPGIWVGMVGCTLDAYTTGGSKQNTNAALVIVSADLVNKQLVLSGNSSDLSALAATNNLFFQGAKSKECNGVDKILTNTGSLYNIDASVYELWKSTSYAAGGAIDMNKVLLAASQATVLGLKEEAMVLISPKGWTSLNNNLASLRRLDESYSNMKIENGAEGICYYGVNGKMEVISHPFVKEGEAFILPVKSLKRIGSTPITFKRPGNPNSFFREIDAAAGFELRAFSDQQLFNSAPGKSVKITGITYP